MSLTHMHTKRDSSVGETLQLRRSLYIFTRPCLLLREQIFGRIYHLQLQAYAIVLAAEQREVLGEKDKTDFINSGNTVERNTL